MQRRSFRSLSRHALMALALLAPVAPAGAAQLSTLTWPRNFDAAGEHIEMYQPEIEKWEGNRMSGRAAVAVGARDGTPTYGVAHFSAIADIDKPSALVQLSQIQIESVEVPTRPGAADTVRQALVARLPAKGLTVPLDHLQASYAVSQQLGRAVSVPVKNDVPQILFATTPTLLVHVDGDPAWRAVGGTTVERAINSRALLLREAGGELWLNAAGFWYKSESAGGSWTEVPSPPAALLGAAGKIRANKAEPQPDPMLPASGRPPARAPTVLLATQPAELIVTTGAPRMTPVGGASLLTVSNADHAVFVDPAANQFYVLLSGRWFRAPLLTGPWEHVAGNQLPADFAKISPQDPKANVLVSVPGTPQAREAGIAATIPQTASVSRSKATVAVVYDGTPKFVPITGTSLHYAVNTATPVIEVDNSHYYAVANGVWFTASVPGGPWRVAAEVPSAIYTIPPGSPIYYVTYVRIYAVTPDAVVVGYTPGYLGVVVSPDGTVVYGTGYVYPPYVGTYYYGYPVTYGYGAGFGVGVAEGFAFGFAAGAIWGAASPYWGPYWWGGAYNWNYVNVNQANFYGRWGQGTVTHAQGWNTWTGTQWRGTAVSGYNPSTGVRYQGSRGAAFNPYSGNYAAGRQVAGYNAQTGRAGVAQFGVAGNTQTGDRAAGSRGAVVNRDKNNAVVWNNGNVYAGHDGSVYQHTDDGWQKHTGNGWEPVQQNSDVNSRLEQQRQARDVGQQRFGNAAQQWQGRAGGRFHGFRR
ncbi:carbohydrate-binding family V/XII [Cupriavidus campinensis]